MRWTPWVLLVALIVAIVAWVPARIVERQIAAALKPHLEPEGTVAVWARATARGLMRGYVARVHVEAKAIRVGDMAAQRLDATLLGIDLVRTPSGDRTIGRVRGGDATIEFGRADLERFLRSRGVDHPTVAIDASGVIAEGTVRAGGVVLRARVRGQFYAAGSDLRFRVTSLEVSGMDVPAALAETVVGAVRPAVSLRELPFPMVVDQVTSGDGRVVVHARVEAAP